MALNASAYQMIEPSFTEPQLLIQFQQASGYVALLEGETLRTRLAEDDLLVYMKGINVRTKIAGSQASANELPGVDIATSMISTMTYRFKCRSGYDHHDVAAANRWGFSLPEAYRKGMWQAHFQMDRDAALFGLNPQNGEGFVNAPGATATNLPPDQFGNTTISTYDNGQMSQFLLSLVKLIKTRTLQGGMPVHISMLGPQRSMLQFEYNIVQLTSYQRPGGGTSSTVETLRTVLLSNGDTLTWAYDDTLQGAGGNTNTDLILIGMPEVKVPEATNGNTNFFATLQPNNPTCLTQYCDSAAPIEIISPMAGGATDVITERRVTPGWAVRPEALTILSVLYA